MADSTPRLVHIVNPRRPPMKSVRAWTQFKAAISEQGATVLEMEWRGAFKPHRVRCPEGHECSPTPNRVQQGGAICRTCSGRDSQAVWRKFQDRVKNLGGVVLEDAYRGSKLHHRVRCREGHLSSPVPGHVNAGGGICPTCARNDPKAAQARFMEQVVEQGGTVEEPQWHGVNKPHRVRCREGHVARPTPASVTRGSNVCKTCARRDPDASWVKFRARVGELGGVVLEEFWMGTEAPHRVLCANGHECAPWPSGVLSGQGICRFCKGKAWDVFYLVQDEVNDVIKFGITSGDPRIRLGVHEREGFDRVVRVAPGLPGDTAPELERTIIAALRDAREAPVRGREYYRGRTLALVLDLVDNHPAIRAAS